MEDLKTKSYAERCDLFEKYDIKEFLGGGGYGQVYACLSESCKYAIKIVELNYMDVSDFLFEARVTSETDIAKLNIVPKVYAWWICKNKGYIVTEKFDMDLRNYISDFKIQQKDITTLEKMIDKMHKAGFVHADLKPENIFVNIDENNNITDMKIGDWGMVFELGEGPDWSNSYWVIMISYYHTLFGKKCVPLMRELKEDYRKLDFGILCYLQRLV